MTAVVNIDFLRPVWRFLNPNKKNLMLVDAEHSMYGQFTSI